MYFDFYEDRPDYLALNRDMERLESKLHLIVAIMLAFFLDIVGVVLLIVLSSLPASDKGKSVALVEARPEPTRFVFMQPLKDIQSKTARPDAPSSDQNRRAAAPERAENPTNSLPFSRGNTPEFMDQPSRTPPQRMAKNQPQQEMPQAPAQPPGQNGQRGQDGSPNAFVLPNADGAAAAARNGAPGAPGAPGPLSSAVQNPFRYTQGEVFNNPGGDGGEPQAAISFDSKGADFGPWLRRFIAQLKRNWLIPMAAMTMKGHVVVTFNVHRDGRVTDITTVGPCPVQAFNRAAEGALITSNPTYPLPPDYPADRCFFTVTFYYNETPPYR
jgi:TonB family protein